MWTDPLAELRDIHVPELTGWWPPAPGWWLLSLVLLGLLVLACRWVVGRIPLWLQRRRVRREALQALQGLRSRAGSGAAAVTVAAELALLLRRVALSRHPRAKVAGLHGTDWLRFLDQHLPDPVPQNGFADSAGDFITSLPYERSSARIDASTSTEAFDSLLALAELWIRHNAGPAGSKRKARTTASASGSGTTRLQDR